MSCAGVSVLTVSPTGGVWCDAWVAQRPLCRSELPGQARQGGLDPLLAGLSYVSALCQLNVSKYQAIFRDTEL